MKIVYLASFKSSRPTLTKIFVERETSKRYYIAKREDLIGWHYLYKFVHKENNLFDDIWQARDWILQQYQNHIDSLKYQIEKTIEDRDIFLEEINE